MHLRCYYVIPSHSEVLINCLTYPKCLKCPPACDEVAAIIQPPDAVVLDSLTVSEREGEGVLLT